MKFIEAVTQANLEIYRLLREAARSELLREHSQGYGGDISLGADLASERIFVKHLSAFGSIYSEESGRFENKNDNALIIIDPLDGSDNFRSSIPYFGTSVARKEDGIVTHAVIANLADGSLYLKDKNGFERGSLLNKTKEKIIPNKNSNVGIYERAYASRNLPERLRAKSIKYRSLGAIALSLALAHEVDFVLFEGKIREFDIAAGWSMCEDLHRYRNDNFLLVSKDKVIFDKIREIL